MTEFKIDLRKYLWKNQNTNLITTQMESIDIDKIENPNAPRMKPAMMYALVLSVIGIIFMVTGHMVGWDMQSGSYRIATWIISISTIFYIVHHYREQYNNGFLRFGQGVGLCALTGVFAGIITAVFFYFFVKYISPEFLTNIHDQAIEDMMSRGLSDEQIAESMKYASFFMSAGFMAIMAFIMTIGTYTVVGVMASAIFKKG